MQAPAQMRPDGFRSRSSSISSDATTQTTKSTAMSSSGKMPSPKPAPAYVAASAASQLVRDQQRHRVPYESDGEETPVSELYEMPLFSEGALRLVNAFLDQLLYSFLQSARATTLSTLRPAVEQVLKGKLARQATAAAEEELEELLNEGDEENELRMLEGERGERPRWNLNTVWKRTRLRIMVYMHLGEMEDQDEMKYVEEENGVEDPMSRDPAAAAALVSWASAIFLTSILEYIAEQCIATAGQAAYDRAALKKTGKAVPLADEEDGAGLERVVIAEHDVERIALNSTLGRLWRTWRKNLRQPHGRIFTPPQTPSHHHNMSASSPLAKTPQSAPPGSWPEHRKLTSEALGLGKNRRSNGEDADGSMSQPQSARLYPESTYSSELPAEEFARRRKSLEMNRLLSADKRSGHSTRHDEWTEQGSNFQIMRQRSSSLPNRAASPFEISSYQASAKDARQEEDVPPVPERAVEYEETPTRDVVEDETIVESGVDLSTLNAEILPLHTTAATAIEIAARKGKRTAMIVPENSEREAPNEVDSPVRKSPKSSGSSLSPQELQNGMLETEAEGDAPEPAQSYHDQISHRDMHPAPAAPVKDSLDGYETIEETPRFAVVDQGDQVSRNVDARASPKQSASGRTSSSASDKEFYPPPPPPPPIPKTVPADGYYTPPTHNRYESERESSSNSFSPRSRRHGGAPSNWSQDAGQRDQPRSIHSSYYTQTEERASVRRVSESSSSKRSKSTPSAKRSPSFDSNAQKLPRSSQDTGDSYHTAGATAARSEVLKKEFADLVAGEETRKYTLTPRNLVDIEQPDSPQLRQDSALAAAAAQQEVYSQARGMEQNPHDANGLGLASSTIDEQSSYDETYYAQNRNGFVARPSMRNSKPSKAGMMAREPRIQTESTRDFADFIRSTAPNSPQKQSESFAGNSTTTSAEPSRGRNTSKKASLNSSPSTPTVRSGNSTPRVAHPQARPGAKAPLQPRDAVVRGNDTGELAAFFRQGPPGAEISKATSVEASNGRMNDTATLASVNYTNSTTSQSARGSVNSHSALLGTSSSPSQKATPPAPPKTMVNGSGPVRKQRRVKDPYAIDSDDEEDLTALPSNEESLIDFLNNVPPPGHTQTRISPSTDQSSTDSSLQSIHSLRGRGGGVKHSRRPISPIAEATTQAYAYSPPMAGKSAKLLGTDANAKQGVPTFLERDASGPDLTLSAATPIASRDGPIKGTSAKSGSMRGFFKKKTIGASA